MKSRRESVDSGWAFMSHRAGSFSRGRNNNLGVAATHAVSRKEPVFELSDVDSSKQVSEDEQVPGR